jgi:hypothetical protein
MAEGVFAVFPGTPSAAGHPPMVRKAEGPRVEGCSVRPAPEDQGKPGQRVAARAGRESAFAAADLLDFGDTGLERGEVGEGEEVDLGYAPGPGLQEGGDGASAISTKGRHGVWQGAQRPRSRCRGGRRGCRAVVISL